MASTDQDGNGVQVSLSQMLDLALGTPEVGAINLNILHNFLHVLLHQIDLQSTNVEYRGEDTNGIETMVASLKSGPHAKDTWHVVNANKIPNVGAEGIDKTEIAGSNAVPNDQLKLLDERVTELEMNLVYLNDDLKNFKEEQNMPPGFVTELSSVASKSGRQIPTAPLKSERGLPTTASKSDQQFSTTDSKHSEHLPREPSKSVNQALGDNETPVKIKKEIPDIDTEQEISNSVAEISQTPNAPLVAPKIEKQEARIDESSSKQTTQSKASVIRRESVIGGVNDLRNDMLTVKNDIVQSKAEVAELRNEVGKVKQDSIELHSLVGKLQETMENYVIPTGIDANTINLHGVPSSSQSDAKTPQVLLSTQTQSRADIQAQNPIPTPSTVKSSNHAVISPTALNVRQPESVAGIASTTSLTSAPVSAKIKHETSNTFGNIPIGGGQNRQLMEATELFGNLPKDEGQKIQLMEAIRNMEIMYGEAMRNLDSRVIELENYVKFINEKIGDLQNGVRCGNDGIQEIQELVDRIQGIQEDIEKINQTAARLCEERENRDMHTKALGDEIELLKSVKADKEDLEDALADKADARIVNRKVSCDKFDTTCDDLARGLEDAISKLTQQETIWQQALDAVQQEVESKLDKIEISPIREFVNNQLKVLQDKLKKLDEKRRENEAAGTKKILTDVQCISCDKNVVMKIAEGVNYRADPLPGNRSIKPYLTYELDQVRKQQKKLPGRSMIQFTGAIQEPGRKAKHAKDDHMDSRDHFCNRYCGGSHTITNPHQRVMRMGHFLAQWGPEAVQLTEGKVRGTDGQLYKGRPLPPGAATGKPDLCDPCVCSETKTERTSSPLTNRTEDSAILSKTGQINQSRKSSIIQTSSRRPSSKKISESLEEIRSTQSLRREQKSVVSNVPPPTIKEEEHPEPPSPGQNVSPQRASIIRNPEENEEDENLNEDFETTQESV